MDYLEECVESLRIRDSRKRERLCSLLTPEDSIVESVREELKQRSTTGFAKYGTTLDRTDIDLAGWLQHLKEELLDAALYVERIKKEIEGGTEF